MICFIIWTTNKSIVFVDDLAKLFSEYEVTVPTLVNSAGEYISHDLENAQSLTQEHYLRRRRRATHERDYVSMAVSDDDSVPKSNASIDMHGDMYYDPPAINTTTDNPNTLGRNSSLFFRSRSSTPPSYAQRQYVHFNVSAFGSRLLLKVETKSRLIAPGAKSVVFTSDGRRIEKDLSLSCYFFGKILQQPNSKVAISNCNGLVSVVFY